VLHEDEDAKVSTSVWKWCSN